MTHRHYFWFLFLLFHYSCNLFSRETVTYEHKDWGADIAINDDGVECTGTINGSPVLHLSGKITKNVPGVADPILGAVFMTQGQELEGLASIIQKHEVKLQGTSQGGPVMNMLTPLSGGNFVTYERIEHSAHGAVAFDVSSLDPKKGLKSDTAYDTALFIKIGPHVFYTADKVCYTTPVQEDAAKVKMHKPVSKHTYDDGLKIQLSMAAGVSEWDSNSGTANAGFLLIEQRKGLFSQVEVIERHLGNRGDSSIFSRGAGTLFEDGAGVILCLADGNFQGDPTFSIEDVKDKEGLLKKGETYHVFGVVEQGNDYYVSTNLKSITLPEVDIALAMGDIEDKKLYVAGTDVKQFEVTLGGEITKQENATDPIAGFLFVPQGERPTDEALKKTISDATDNYSDASNHIWLPKQGDSSVCVTYRNIGSGPVQLEKQTINLLDHLDHKKDYKVYFWVQDHKGQGPIFLSGEGKPLSFLYVEEDDRGSVEEQFRLDNSLKLTCTLSTRKSANSVGAEFGILFTTQNPITDLDANAMNQLACQYNKEKATSIGWRRLKEHDRIYISGSTAPSIVEAKVGGDEGLAGRTQYHCHLVVCKQGMVYVLPRNSIYDTKQEVKNVQRRSIPINAELSKSNPSDADCLNEYLLQEVQLTREAPFKAYLIDTTENERSLDPDDENDKALIRAIINTYCGVGQRQVEYDNYKVSD